RGSHDRRRGLFASVRVPSATTVRLFFFNHPAATELYPLSLHDALPISSRRSAAPTRAATGPYGAPPGTAGRAMPRASRVRARRRSEEHTSELQSRENLVCRLLLEKKHKEHRIHLTR